MYLGIKFIIMDDLRPTSLIHRHYDLATDERNVESDGKTVASKDLDGIYPSSWTFYQARWYSYEYKRYAVPQPPAPFVADLGEILVCRHIQMGL